MTDAVKRLVDAIKYVVDTEQETKGLAAMVIRALPELEATLWQSIETLKDAPDMVLAGVPACEKFPDGRIMPYSRDMLIRNLEGPTPEHLKFPATGWKPMPTPPQGEKES